MHVERVLERHLAPRSKQLVHRELGLSWLERIIIDMPVLLERQVLQMLVQRLEARRHDLVVELP